MSLPAPDTVLHPEMALKGPSSARVISTVRSFLAMTANRIGNNVFSGTLYETSGPAFNTVPFDSNAVSYHAVGTGTLDFSDANNGTFSYNVNGIAQSKPVTRTVFGNLPVCTTSATPSDRM